MFKKSIKLAVTIVVAGLVLYFNKDRLRIFWYEAGRPRLPQSVGIMDNGSPDEANREEIEKDEKIKNDLNTTPDPSSQRRGIIPAEYNLAVPFASQAPFGDWGMPYQEACEEASLIMAARYFAGQTLTPQEMDEEIKKLVAWEKERFGYYEDTTSAEVAAIAQEYFNLSAYLDYDVSVDSIKKYLSQNKLVLVPAAGRILPNPYFTGDGPLYHMLVIRGYTTDRFITNDPGTRRGQEFVYKYNDLIAAVHDWPRSQGGAKSDVTAQDMLTGQKVMIVISKK